MASREQVQSLSKAEVVDLLHAREQRVAELEQQLDWFERQIFGPRSERRETATASNRAILGGHLRDVQGAKSDAPDSGIRSKRGSLAANLRGGTKFRALV